MRRFSVFHFVGGLFISLTILLSAPFIPESLGSVAMAADAADNSDSIVITSDRLEMDDKKHTAIFQGDVRANENKLNLSADKMIVRYYRKNRRSSKKKQSRQSGVDSIKAEGNVVLLQGDSRGIAEKMVYRVQSRTLEMLGIHKKASIRHGADRLEGKKILLTLGLDRSISKVSVQGGGRQRVSARISPSSNDDDRSDNRNSPPSVTPKRGGKGDMNRKDRP